MAAPAKETVRYSELGRPQTCLDERAEEHLGERTEERGEIPDCREGLIQAKQEGLAEGYGRTKGERPRVQGVS